MSVPTAALIIAPAFGLAVGSFTNVIIDRLPVALEEPNEFGELWDTRPWREVLGGTSRCSSCGIEVRPIDNIPVVSFIMLRGKCRGCGEKIPRFHTFVELLVPLLVVAAVLQLGLVAALIPVLWLIPAGVAIGVIDFNTLIVPTKLVWPTFAGSVLIAVGISAYESSWRPLLGAVIGVAVMAGPLFALWWVLYTKMGLGDVRLAVLLGWNIGYAAMSVSDRPVSTVFLTLAAVTLAAALGIVLGIVLQAGFGTKVPFGPPLLAGALFCMLYAEPILRPFG